MAKPLRIMHWNARGLRNKVAPLCLLLNEQQIDVALISETFLGPADKLRFPGYVTYRQDEKSDAGHIYRGLAILVKRRVVHQLLPLPTPSTFYALGVQLHVAGEDVDIYAAYIPPSAPFDVVELRALMLQSPRPTILAGDLNCKHPAWNSRITSTGGRRLFADAEAHGYVVSGPDGPTHFPDNLRCAPDVLDIMVHRGLNCQIAQQVLDDEMRSDHQPVLVVLSGMPVRLPPPAPRRKTDWSSFQEALETTTPTWPIVTAADVDGMASEVTACIQRAYEQATTTLTHSQGLLRRPLPRHLRDMVAKTRRLRKRWLITKCPRQKTELNRLAEKTRAKLQEHNAESWESYIESTEGDWPAIHRLCRQVTGTPAPVRPLLLQFCSFPKFRSNENCLTFTFSKPTLIHKCCERKYEFDR